MVEKWRISSTVIGVFIIALIFNVCFPQMAILSEPSRSELLKKYDELIISFKGLDETPLIQAEAVLTSALELYSDDEIFLNHRAMLRIQLKRYEDALADINHIESLADEPWQSANIQKCMLMERLGRPEDDCLTCYKVLIEKIKMIPKGALPNMAINLNLAVASAYVKDFDAAENFLEKVKNDSNFDQETYMYYQTIVNALKTSEGRKEVIYSSLP